VTKTRVILFLLLLMSTNEQGIKVNKKELYKNKKNDLLPLSMLLIMLPNPKATSQTLVMPL
jgi:hypothetical protein